MNSFYTSAITVGIMAVGSCFLGPYGSLDLLGSAAVMLSFGLGETLGTRCVMKATRLGGYERGQCLIVEFMTLEHFC